MSPHDHVLVGLDASEGGRAALRYGIDQARRRQLGLRLMHVWPEGLPPLGTTVASYPGTEAETETRGAQLLEDSAEMARRTVPGLDVTTVLVHGDRISTLVRASEQARLTVLGDQRRPALDRITTGSMLTGVAGQSHGPVVAVPAGWEPGRRGAGVVAAVKSCADSRGLVYRAMEAAVDQEAPLTLLHAWQLPMIYDEYIANRVGEDACEREARQELEELVASVRGDFPPDLAVAIEVHHGQAAHAIIEASVGADLILLARRPHGFPVGHLGGTGRAVLREARCPVEVLAPAAAPPALHDLVVETRGEAVKASERQPTEVAT